MSTLRSPGRRTAGPRLALGACLVGASLALAPLPAAAQATVARLPGYDAPFALDSAAQSREIAAPRPLVYRALLDVLAELQLPVTTDSARWIVGHEPFQKRRAIGKLAMAQLFDCGMGSMTPNASTFRLRIAYVAWVDSLAPDRSRLRFGVGASGEDDEGPRKPAVACGSLGRLESTVLQRVDAKLR